MLWGMVLVTTAVADATVVARNMQPQRDLDIEGIPVNNNDFLRISEEEIDFDYWSSTAVRAKGKSCEKAGGKCMLKKTVKKMCKGKVDKKSKCDKKNYICCISDETTSAPLTCPVVTCEPCQTTEIITEESVNQCVGENKENSILWNKVDSAETILKATINEGNYNATGAIEIKIHNLEMELQLMKYNIADGNSKLDYLIKILDGPTKKSTTRAPIKQTPTTLTSEAPTTKSPTWTPTTQAPTFITSEAPITVLWRDDARCGPSYPLPDGRPAQCHPDSFYGCCSPSGWCGHTPAHCTCSSCIDYRAVCDPNCTNGECIGPNICKCNQGWTGNLCQTPVCSPSCINGECTEPNICNCSQGWIGNLCQTPVCSPSCINGECTEPNICNCSQGWTGNLCQTRNCSEAEGFFMLNGSKQCFKYYKDGEVRWEDGKSKCESKGLQLAEPSDDIAVTLRKYIQDTYGMGLSIWLGARGDGSSFRWENNREMIPNNSPLWAVGQPIGIRRDHCLLLNNYNTLPYSAYNCKGSYFYVLCERSFKTPSTISTISTTTTIPPPQKCSCGIPNNPPPRIIGGQEVVPYTYPWHVGLKHYDTTYSSSCGGTIINSLYVLTAAECEQEMIRYGYVMFIAIGDHDDYDDTEFTTFTQHIAVVDKIKHPLFDWSTYEYNFALLRLASPIQFNNGFGIRPICLPDDDQSTYENETAKILGWGVDDGGWKSHTLQEADVVILPPNCDNKHSHVNINSTMLCAASPGKGACYGDEGGSLAMMEDGQYIQVGIYSAYGYYKCHERDHDHQPGVYSRVTVVLDWIKETAKAGQWCMEGET